jgi:hypothetical protein
VKPTLIPLQRTALDHFSDQKFALWAAERHAQTCHSCRRGEECQRGQLLAQAAKNSNDDISTYPAI